MLGRVHTTLALVLIALVPAVPLGMWIYAKAATVDRGDAVAANVRVIRSVGSFPGSRSNGASSYAQRKWEGENLVPITGYWTEAFYTAPRGTTIDELVAWYDRRLRGWRRQEEPVDCSIFSEPPNCKLRTISWRRHGVHLRLDTAESDFPRTREYSLYVSQ